MKYHWMAVCALSMILTDPASAQVSIFSKMDINAMRSAGQASVTHTTWDIGAIEHIFDGE